MSKGKSQLHGIGYPPPRGTPEEREREKAEIYMQGLLTPQSRQNHLLCCSVSKTFPSFFLSASFLHLRGRHLRTTDPGCYVGGARVATYPLVCGEKTQVRSYDWCTATILVFTQIPQTVQKSWDSKRCWILLLLLLWRRNGCLTLTFLLAWGRRTTDLASHLCRPAFCRGRREDWSNCQNSLWTKIDTTRNLNFASDKLMDHH